MKNLIVVGRKCVNLEMTYEAIKKVSIENKVSSICVGSDKGELNPVEWQAHLFANHHDLVMFDASINIPKRKMFSLPVSQTKRILDKAKRWENNIMLVLHNGDLNTYRRVIKKAISAKIDIITIQVD